MTIRKSCIFGPPYGDSHDQARKGFKKCGGTLITILDVLSKPLLDAVHVRTKTVFMQGTLSPESWEIPTRWDRSDWVRISWPKDSERGSSLTLAKDVSRGVEEMKDRQWRE